MDFIQAIILGIVEGITEFLPISSTGHLILASEFLKIPQTEFVKTFEIAIQSGAILSVVFLYRATLLKETLSMGRPFGLSPQGRRLAKLVLTAFLPSAVIGLLFYKVIKQYLIGNSEVVVISLFLGGIVLIAVEFLIMRGVKRQDPEQILSYERAFVIGLFQSVSIIPGISRAAATIIGGLLVGLPRKTAVEFSFFLAIPTMLAATALDLGQTSFAFDLNQWLALTVGFITSFIIALIAIKWLLKYVQTHSFIPFGIYRIALALLYFFFLR